MGDLVYVGTQAAVDECGRLSGAAVDPRARHFHDGSALEMSTIVDRLVTIAAAAGTSLSQMLRLRLNVSHVENVPAAVLVIRQRIGDNVPVSIIEDAGASGWLGDATISADAVFHAPV